MRIVTLSLAWLAAVIHVLFFCLESLLWQHPKVLTIFQQTAEQATTTRLLAFNQGFYNLFLALGLAVGLVMWKKGKETVGKTLILYICTFMVGAALVLFFSSPSLIKGVLAQGVPPLLVLVFFSSLKK